jgi:hypothetical protein
MVLRVADLDHDDGELLLVQTRKIGIFIGIGTLVVASLAFANSSLDIKLRDKCDPATCNAGRPTPLCSGPRTGSVTLQTFLDAIPGGGHNAWKYNPGTSGASIDNGGTVHFAVDGGETHTFTRVAAFGGGVVPSFNAAVGNAPTTPECQAMVQNGSDRNTSRNPQFEGRCTRRWSEDGRRPGDAYTC